MANNNPETLAKLYRLFLYKKKDIIAIQEKLGDLIPIQENLNIDGNPILEEAPRSNKASTDISLGEIFNLLMYLEDDIIEIQKELGIVGYSNQERAEEADKNARAYLRKFEEFYGPLEVVPSILIQKNVLFYWRGAPIISEGHSHQLHEIFIKNSAGTDQCSCLV
ncbi:hypothetical protein C1646_764922 [Rhizophagus diaphanus]|nr:hypothetical protein C1646_764922 [Rhizophagus diaphanus] [Rhizophagus sp. MUCL 43196]